MTETSNPRIKAMLARGANRPDMVELKNGSTHGLVDAVEATRVLIYEIFPESELKKESIIGYLGRALANATRKYDGPDVQLLIDHGVVGDDGYLLPIYADVLESIHLKSGGFMYNDKFSALADRQSVRYVG